MKQKNNTAIRRRHPASVASALLATCLLALATLAACSGDDDPADNRHPAPGDPGTIRFTATIADFADDARQALSPCLRGSTPEGGEGVKEGGSKNATSQKGNNFSYACKINSSVCFAATSPKTGEESVPRKGEGVLSAPSTRALISTADGRGTFEEGDRINIITHVSGTTVATDHPATYHDGAWLTDLTWEDFGPGAKVDFTAYFPALLFSQLNPQTIDIPTDQSTPGKYAAADYLFVSARNQQQNDTPIELRFRHALHRLVVKLVLDEHPGSLTQADLDAATVVIKNAPIRGRATLNGIETDYVTEGDIHPLPHGNNTCCALIPWVDDTKFGSLNESIEVRTAGTVASYRIQWPAAPLIYANYQTLIRLTLADNEGLGNYITTYAALKSACKAASSDPDNPTRITLGADIVFPGTTSDYISIPSYKYVEINGNGYRLTRADASAQLFTVSYDASLKLTCMTVDGENKEANAPLIEVATMNRSSDFYPGTLTLGEGFTLTGATLSEYASDPTKLNSFPGIDVRGALIMEEGSQVTGNGRGYPVYVNGGFKASLRLEGGTFSNNTDEDLFLTCGRGVNADFSPTVTVARPLPAGFSCSIVLEDYLDANENIRFPTVITGTATCALTAADVQKFPLMNRLFYRNADGELRASAPGKFSLYLNGADIGLRQGQ